MQKPKRPDDLGQDVDLEWHPDFEGEYAVTDDGRVYSYHGSDPHCLSPHVTKQGYEHVSLHSNGERHQRQVHVLVLETFEGYAPDGHECRHKNSDPADNRIENLMWGTRSENALDKYRHESGQTNRGEKHPSAKLTDEEAREIVRKYETGEYTQSELAEEYGVSQPFVCRLLNGKRRMQLVYEGVTEGEFKTQMNLW